MPVHPDARAVDDAPAPAWPGIERGTRDFRRAILAMLCAGYATFALLYCVQPLLPEFAREFHLGAAKASLALSLTTGSMSVTMLVVSVVSETRGRRALMIASMMVASTLTLTSAFVSSWPMFLLVRALLGLSFAGLPALAMAWLGEEMHGAALGVAMGLYVGGTGIGGMTGRLLTALVTDWMGWRVAVGVIGVLGLLAAVAFWRLLPRSRRFVPSVGGSPAAMRGFAEHLRDTTMLRLFGVGFAVLGALVVLYNAVAFRLTAPPYRLSETSVGLIFLLYLAGVGSSGWTGSLVSRYGRAMLIRICLAMMIAGAAITLARPLTMVVFGIAIVTIGFFGAHAVASGWVAAHAKRGRAQGAALYLCFYYLGSSIAGWAGGVAWDAAGWTGTVTLIAALAASALLSTTGMTAPRARLEVR